MQLYEFEASPIPVASACSSPRKESGSNPNKLMSPAADNRSRGEATTARSKRDSELRSEGGPMESTIESFNLWPIATSAACLASGLVLPQGLAESVSPGKIGLQSQGLVELDASFAPLPLVG